MKKVSGQAFLMSLFLLFLATIAQSSSIPEWKKNYTYSILKPVLESIGYFPLKITTYDSDFLTPIADAIVMIGEGENQPFQNNWARTDKDGTVTFNGFSIPKGPKTISVRHPHYSGCTVFQTDANELKIPLTRLEDTPPKTAITGTFSEWPYMEDFDDTVHVGFLLPFIDMISIINFSTDKLLAPPMKAEIYKETEVPGNLVIPTQEEKYMEFIPVYVSKPNYRMPFLTGSRQNLIALAGEFPFSKLVKGFLDKKPLTELLNLVSLSQFGIATDFDVPQESTTLNIPLSYSLTQTYNVESHHLPDSNKDIIFVSLSSFERDKGSVFPFDFKISSRKDEVKKAFLKSVYSRQGLLPMKDLIATVAADLPTNSDDQRTLDRALTGALKRPQRLNYKIQFDNFLDLFNLFSENNALFSYQHRDHSQYSVDPHLNISFFNVILADTKEKKGYQKTWWTVISPASLSSFQLPKLPQGLSDMPSLQPNEELRWVLNQFAFHEKNFRFSYHQLTKDMLTAQMTHFSRNSLTLVAPKIE